MTTEMVTLYQRLAAILAETVSGLGLLPGLMLLSSMPQTLGGSPCQFIKRELLPLGISETVVGFIGLKKLLTSRHGVEYHKVARQCHLHQGFYGSHCFVFVAHKIILLRNVLFKIRFRFSFCKDRTNN